MGKRYYCDYCHKTMVSTLSVIKTHNKGMAHQKLVQDHYHQFKDPEEILAEESQKKPCIRYPKGECGFGAICRYSHYNKEELDELRDIVARRKAKESEVLQPSFHDLYLKLQTEKSNDLHNSQENTLIDDNGVTHVLPWDYNAELDKYNLPPSIKRIKAEDFKDLQLTEWG